MITITIRVCGDYWANPEEVRLQLDAVAGQDQILLDLQAEGPGLGCLGITDMIDAYCCTYQVDPATVLVDHWSNSAESVPYTVVNSHLLSHFFSFSANYWLNDISESTHKHVFGYFIGRKTIPRAVSMYQLYHTYGSRILFSCLRHPIDVPGRETDSGIHLEHLENWLPTQQHQSFYAWWESDPIQSLDHHRMTDQYNTDYNTNKDLLKFYTEFDIELVSESYTRGQTFFPTEKSVRPIMAAKPIMVQGPVNYLENLRKLGFDTYSTVWDESYDLLEGPARWQTIQQQINKIMNMNNIEYTEMINAANNIAIRNRNHLANIIGSK
jgi:hypothetical protein